MKQNPLVEHLLGYVETSVELAKLEVKEAIAKIIRVFLSIFITATFILAVLFFLNVSLAFYLNYHYKFADQFEGFGIVGLLNIVLMVVFFFLRPFLARIIEKQIEKQMPSKIK